MPVPLRSMSDPDQDFDKEVCMCSPAQKSVATQDLQSADSASYMGESTSSLSPQGQLVENWNREDMYSWEHWAAQGSPRCRAPHPTTV